jgi:CHAT domain-containing protein/Tfp pilus assembly protein PilF
MEHRMRPSQDPPAPKQKLAALGQGKATLTADAVAWLGMATRGPRWTVAAAVVLGVAVWLAAGTAAAQGTGGTASTAELEEARRLNGEVEALFQAGKYDEAVPRAQSALAIREKALGPDHPDVAASLNNLALLYGEKREYGRAEPLYLRAFAILEKALGPDHPKVAISLHNLALLYGEKGEYGRAEPLYLRALAILEKALGLDHPKVATSLNNLAMLYGKKGEYGRAEPLFQRALAILEKALGPDHPDVATSLNNLAMLYHSRGEYGRAEPLFQRALAIREKALGPEHPDVANSLNNLALLFKAKEEYGRAEPLQERALAIVEKALGPDHPYVATTLNNLALLYDSTGEYGRAEPLQQRALAIVEKALGPDHPDVATSLNNLAMLYHSRGEYGRAEPLYQRALAIREKALGLDHPDVATSLDNLAVLYWAAGRLPEAIDADTRGQDVREKTLGLLIATGSESQKLAFLRPFLGDPYTDVTLALDTRDGRTGRLALLTLFRRKGRALDAMAGSMHALRARLGPEEQKLFDELQAARSRYVTLSLRGPAATPLPAYRHDLDALNEQIRQREAAISQRSEEFRAAERSVTVAAVQEALPDATALVEWTVYHAFNPKAHIEKEKWGPSRYAASVLPKHGDPTWVDLGDAATIDADIQALRDAFARPADKDATKLARALEAKVMAPVRTLLGDTHRVFVSPDGALNLIPFAALTGDDGRPLIERYAFTYLTSGRDLLRRALHVPVRAAPVVVSAPDFDKGAPRGGPFAPLLHSAEVSDTVAARFKHPAHIPLTGGEATKARLQQVHGPQFLHLDSHGYFSASVCNPAPPEELRDSPLLRSGIALAGANACRSGHNEGLLTASEASGLDLYGTRLVVLSACETGVGEAEAGDGVYGLRRALVLAGAETQVMSLWPVDGAATAELMKAYYEALARGGGRSEAMRQVQLAMLHDSRREHPYYWAAFIVSGDDRALDGKPVLPDVRVHPGGACACRMGETAPEGSPLWVMGAAAFALAGRRRGGAP